MNSRDFDIVEKAYSKWRFPLLRFLRRKMTNDTEAEDLVQESFLRWAASVTVSNVERPHSFLFKIATNLLYDRSRRQSVRKDIMSSIDDLADTGLQARCNAAQAAYGTANSPEQQVASRQALALLQHAINELPPRQREVFLLHRVEGLTQEEVAL